MDKTHSFMYCLQMYSLNHSMKNQFHRKIHGMNFSVLSWNKDFNMNNTENYHVSMDIFHFPSILSLILYSLSGIIFVHPTITPIHVPAVFNVNSARCRRVHSVLESSSPGTGRGSLSLFQKYDTKRKQSQNNDDRYKYSNQTSSGQSITCQHRT